MTIAAAGKLGAKAAAHGVTTAAGAGGSGDNEELIIVMMVVSAGLIFIDHDRSGKPQDGNQYIALGIVGFFLMVLDRFWPELALAFAGLFTLSIILNTPNGIPFVPSSSGSGTSGGSVSSGSSGGGGGSAAAASTSNAAARVVQQAPVYSVGSASSGFIHP